MTLDRVEIAEEARTDLHEVISYIAERKPIAGERVRATLEDVIRLLADDAPRIDGAVVRLQSGVEVRRWFVHPVVVF